MVGERICQWWQSQFDAGMEASIDLWVSRIGNDRDSFVHLVMHRYHEFDHQRALIEALLRNLSTSFR